MIAKAGIPVRVGVRGHALAPCLTHLYDIGSPRTWGPNERLNAIRVLGFDVPPIAPHVVVVEAARAAARARLASWGIGPTTPFAAVHPFGSTRRHWWPIERVSQLADDLMRQHGLRTVLIGGPDSRLALPPSLRDVVVDATVPVSELVAVLAEAAVVISTDSGPFHLAGAVGTPLVGLFRARRPEHAGRYPQAQVLFGRDDTCASLCAWDRCQELPCRQMRDLSPEEVCETTRRALGASAVAQSR
jgi:ADP-heptose:LPS heptosyltransferase